MARFSVRLRQDAQPFTARLGTGSDSLAVTFQSRIEGAANPVYEGDYTVIPTPATQVLKTKSRIMEDDLTVSQIPFYQASNESGDTVYIGMEVSVYGN